MKTLAVVALVMAGCSSPKFGSEDDGKSVDVSVGYSFIVTLTASNDSLHPGAPEITGDAVDFIRCDREPPPPRRPGAAGSDHYIFKAMAKGESTLQFWRTHRAEDGTSRREKGYQLTVVVR